MPCGTCKDLRKDLIDHVTHGRMIQAAATATKAVKFAATGKAPAPPPVVPRSR